LKKLFLILTILFGIIYPSEYLWPNDYEGSITTTFAEPRFRRFHAGIDIRTYGEIGSNIYAIYDGYINRIKIESDNYGKAIYIKLTDGNIVLYSHLSKFNPKIEVLIKKLQKKYNSSFFDHSLNKSEYIYVNKGDVIGYTGDTGSLSGPHIHFEIRDELNQPINPLLKYYKIEDQLPPLAKSITFIPLNSKTWINSIQDYQTINLKKINNNKFIIQDTVSVVGEFGIALETYDVIDNLLEFKFGVCNIQLLIDNIEYYSIQFDNYNFNENPLIYTEVDYMLLKNNNLSHRLFNKNDYSLSFIKSANNGKINLDEKFHNLVINVSDANNNQIQIQGVLTGKSNPVIDANLLNSNEKVIVQFNNEHDNQIFLNKDSKYFNVNNNQPIDILSLNNNEFEIYNFNEDFDIIEYYTKNKNGVSSRKSYLSSILLDPYKIKGDFSIKHIDNGIIIEFTEDIFSGYTPKLIINSNDEQTYELYRKNKNVLSSGLISIQNINKISIQYDSKPKMIFTKEINSFTSDNNNSYRFNDYKINYSEDSFYFKTLFWIEKLAFKINKKFTQISRPIDINPKTVPFRKKIELNYEVNNCDNCGFYKYDSINEIWEYSSTSYIDTLIKTEIASGGIFSVLEEKEKPNIYNLIPAPNSKYKQKDITKIKFNLTDELSGINEKKIKITINGENLFYDYIHYRNLIIAELNSILPPGKHILEIMVYDNVDNLKTIKGQFTIIE